MDLVKELDTYKQKLQTAVQVRLFIFIISSEMRKWRKIRGMWGFILVISRFATKSDDMRTSYPT